MLCRCIQIAVEGGGGTVGRYSRSGKTNLVRFQRPHFFPALTAANSLASHPRQAAGPPLSNGVSCGKQRTSIESLVHLGQQKRWSSAVTEETAEDEQVTKRCRKRRPRPVEENVGIKELRVQLRPVTEQGSSGSRRVRKVAMLPGIVYSSVTKGGGELRPQRYFVKTPRKVAVDEIRRLQSSFENTVYKLVVEGERLCKDGSPEVVLRALVLPNEVRLHAVHSGILNVNYIVYRPGRRQQVPIRFINADLNLNVQKKGAIVVRMKTHQYIVLPEKPEDVPQWVDLDLEHVVSGSTLRVRDLKVPPGIKLFRGHEPQIWDELVCTVKGKKIFVGEYDPDLDPL